MIHILSERLSRTPCAWLERGLNVIAMLCAYRANGFKVTREYINTSIASKKQELNEIKLRKEIGYKKYEKHFTEAEPFAKIPVQT